MCNKHHTQHNLGLNLNKTEFLTIDLNEINTITVSESDLPRAQWFHIIFQSGQLEWSDHSTTGILCDWRINARFKSKRFCNVVRLQWLWMVANNQRQLTPFRGFLLYVDVNSLVNIDLNMQDDRKRPKDWMKHADDLRHSQLHSDQVDLEEPKLKKGR